MAIVKQIVCLANSRKLSGRCIAGKEIKKGKPLRWIRPVSARENEEVSEYERQYQDGSDPRVLDIINVPLLEPMPKGYQRENWLLDPEHYWAKVGQIGWGGLHRLADPVTQLWINGHSTYNGINDFIPLVLAENLDNSIRLVWVDRLTLSVFKPGEAFGNTKRRVQGCFRYDGKEYRLWVTDPTYEWRYLSRQDGVYEIGESFLTVSLGEPYNDACYKLIAAIIECGRGGTGI